jgi:hypothetical protein
METPRRVTKSTRFCAKKLLIDKRSTPHVPPRPAVVIVCSLTLPCNSTLVLVCCTTSVTVADDRIDG